MKYNLNLSPEEIATVKGALSPTGYRILVAIAKVEEKVGSVFIPQARQSDEEVASILGRVVSIGHDAYGDPNRFPNGRYCEEGDVILMASYSGRRFKIGEREFRLINDDTVMAVVANSDAVERAGVA